MIPNFYYICKIQTKYKYTAILKDLQKHVHILLAAVLILAPSLLHAQNAAKLTLDAICLDPGHGGKDPGCVAKDGTREKDIVLSIGLKVREMLNKECPGMKVLMTRSDDSFIELAQRANIANRNGAKLFLSLHINAVDPKLNKNYASVSGFSVHTMGKSKTESNMEMVKRENSVILLEDDHESKYEGFNPNDPESYIIFNLMQNANLSQSLLFCSVMLEKLGDGPVSKNRGVSQDSYLVLWKTTMPAVLLEYGFITNQGDLSKIKTASVQEDVACRIKDAILKYKAQYEGAELTDSAGRQEVAAVSAENSAEKEEAKAAADDGNLSCYAIQVLASSKIMKENDAFFRSNPSLRVKTGGLYKYLICPSCSLDEVRKTYDAKKSQFQGCFIVRVKDGNIERVK